MRKALMSFLALAALPASLAAEGLQIAHDGVGCVVAERFPAFEARLDPADAVAEARVLFRPPRGAHWYAVKMKREGAAYTTVLPKPKKGLAGFTYYIEATDRALATTRTEEFNPVVADGAGGCQGKVAAPAMGAGQVALEAVSGAPRIPAGFSSSGVASTTGATVAAGATAAVAGGTAVAAAGGGGIGTGLLIAGGVVVAGGAAAAVALGGGGGGDPDPEDGLQRTPVRVRAQVFGYFVPNPANPLGPGLYNTPVVGAIVSTSLDSVTTTTGSDGTFDLLTQTRLPFSTGCTAFTLTIVASGYPTYSLAQNWVSPPTGPIDKIISLVPPMPNASSLSPCVP